jgi:hypothetical protein
MDDLYAILFTINRDFDTMRSYVEDDEGEIQYFKTEEDAKDFIVANNLDSKEGWYTQYGFTIDYRVEKAS